jgi:flagellar basal-body rod protein FlgF/flagellar basal-body rod protein FlgG
VNPVASAVDLVVVQRSAEMMQRALGMFHSEFNRIATEDLPKVTP